MKNYTDNDYALNKINETAIIYRTAFGVVEVALADYLKENPDKTDADFIKLKALSDSDYFDRDRDDYRQTWKNVSLHGLDESKACAVPSPEHKLIEEPEQAAREARRRELAAQAFNTLTEVQQRRYLMYHVEGLTTRAIAEKEGVEQRSVMDSIEWAEKKLKIFLKKNNI